MQIANTYKKLYGYYGQYLSMYFLWSIIVEFVTMKFVIAIPRRYNLGKKFVANPKNINFSLESY